MTNLSEVKYLPPDAAQAIAQTNEPIPGAMYVRCVMGCGSSASIIEPAPEIEAAAPTPEINKPAEQWHVMICVRACGGDHTAGLMLCKLLYWWPKKRANHRGVKKSVTDWEAELMLGEKPVKRINDKLLKMGFVEIYKAPWGHFKSDSTFYVLTPKALALLKTPLPIGEVVKAPLPKAPLPMGGVVSEAPLPTGEVTKNTYNPTKKEKTKAVDEKTSTLPADSKPASGKDKSTPKEPLKAFDVWKKNVQLHFPEKYIEPQATDIKNLGPKMRRLFKSGVTDYLAFLEWITTEEGFQKVQYDWNGIWDGDVNKLANPPMWPDLPFLLNERNLAVSVAIYQHVTKPAPTPEQEEQEQAAYLAEQEAHKAEMAAQKAKANEEILALQAEKASAPAPVTKPNKFQAQIQATQQPVTVTDGLPVPIATPEVAEPSIEVVLEPEPVPVECPVVFLADSVKPAPLLMDDEPQQQATPEQIRKWFMEAMAHKQAADIEAARIKAKTELTASANPHHKAKATGPNMFQSGKVKHKAHAVTA